MTTALFTQAAVHHWPLMHAILGNCDLSRVEMPIRRLTASIHLCIQNEVSAELKVSPRGVMGPAWLLVTSTVCLLGVLPRLKNVAMLAWRVVVRHNWLHN
jgi:hypothetical protein